MKISFYPQIILPPPKPSTEELKKEGHAAYRKFWQDNNVVELSKEDIFIAGYIYPKT